MSVTATAIGTPHVVGDLQLRIADLAFDSSYPTGGEPVAASLFGLNSIDFLLAEPALGYTFEYDHANSKLIARQGDNTNVAAAPAVQVPNTTNLAAVTGVRVLVLGR